VHQSRCTESSLGQNEIILSIEWLRFNSVNPPSCTPVWLGCIWVLIIELYEEYRRLWYEIMSEEHPAFMLIFFSLLALQQPLGVVFYSPLVGFSLLAYEVS